MKQIEIHKPVYLNLNLGSWYKSNPEWPLLEKFVCITTRPSGLSTHNSPYLQARACKYGELCVLKPLGLVVIHTNFSKSGHSGFDLYQLPRFKFK